MDIRLHWAKNIWFVATNSSPAALKTCTATVIQRFIPWRLPGKQKEQVANGKEDLKSYIDISKLQTAH